MTQRAHRIPPTLPARRGMLAPWYRGRAHGDAPHADQPAPDGTAAAPAPDDAAVPSPGQADEPPLARPEGGGSSVPAVVSSRPPFGHPTF